MTDAAPTDDLLLAATAKWTGDGADAEMVHALAASIRAQAEQLTQAQARIAELERERDAIRELMNMHNLGGWTDALGPMQRALAAEARIAELERRLRAEENYYASMKGCAEAAEARVAELERDLVSARADANSWADQCDELVSVLLEVAEQLPDYFDSANGLHHRIRVALRTEGRSDG